MYRLFEAIDKQADAANPAGEKPASGEARTG